jgi:hypothetical protein
MNKITTVIIPHLIGLFFIVLGWYISILNVGLARFQANVLFTRWTLIGLILIILGAYIPDVWGWIRDRKS